MVQLCKEHLSRDRINSRWLCFLVEFESKLPRTKTGESLKPNKKQDKRFQVEFCNVVHPLNELVLDLIVIRSVRMIKLAEVPLNFIFHDVKQGRCCFLLFLLFS